MEERLSFVMSYECGESMSRLCAAYGVSRQTGYTWLSRYRGGGGAALADLSRARHHQAGAMPAAGAAAIGQLRRERPSWGPKKRRGRGVGAGGGGRPGGGPPGWGR